MKRLFQKSNYGRKRWVIRTEALWRIFTMRLPSLAFAGKILVNEYPKSGGTWLGSMLSDALRLPFPRHRFPPLGACIMHGHYLQRFRNPALVLLWRDPRDLMVSWYHHCVIGSELTSVEFVEFTRNALGFKDYQNIRENLPAFIDYTFTQQPSPSFNWSQFYDAWAANKSAVHVRYEDLRADTPAELIRICRGLDCELSSSRAAEIAQKYSFERLSGRKPGEEKAGAFLRKAVVGDWRSSFNQEAALALDRQVEGRLIDMGYAQSRTWCFDVDQP